MDDVAVLARRAVGHLLVGVRRVVDAGDVGQRVRLRSIAMPPDAPGRRTVWTTAPVRTDTIRSRCRRGRSLTRPVEAPVAASARRRSGTGRRSSSRRTAAGGGRCPSRALVRPDLGAGSAGRRDGEQRAPRPARAARRISRRAGPASGSAPGAAAGGGRPRRPRRCGARRRTSVRPTRSTGSRVGAVREQPQRGRLHLAVARAVAGGGQDLRQLEPGRGGRLGQHLGVVEIEPAAERQPAGGQHERRGVAALGGGERRDAHRHARAGRVARRARPSGMCSAARALLGDICAARARRRRAAGSVPPCSASLSAGHQRQRREHAVHALGSQVRERRCEVEEERGAQPRRTVRRGLPRRAALVQPR